MFHVKSGQINRTSSLVDMLEVMSGTYSEYDSGEWHVVKTPMFLTMTATLDAGNHPLPFTFAVPVAGTLYCADGTTAAVIVRPNDTAVNVPKSGIVTFQVFGDYAEVKANR